MNPPAVVSDSSPLIALAAIGRHSVLETLFEKVFAPSAVILEVTGRGPERPGAAETSAASWIAQREVRDRRAVRDLMGAGLDLGEAEAFALAAELGGALVLVDDRDARRHGKRTGVATLGTIGVLVRAKRHGVLDDLPGALAALAKTGFRMTESLVAEAIQKAEA